MYYFQTKHYASLEFAVKGWYRVDRGKDVNRIHPHVRVVPAEILENNYSGVS